MRIRQRIRAMFGLLAAGVGCAGGDTGRGGAGGDALGDVVGALLSDELSAVARVSPDLEPLAARLDQPVAAAALGDVTPEACGAVAGALDRTCEGVLGLGMAERCLPLAAFYFANDTPRCSGRIALDPEAPGGLERIVAFDLAGEPVDEPPACGDGVVGEGETCDDGNADAWDGCGPTCQIEEFTGCEALIEEEFAAAGIARVDQTLWASPRAHVMVHPGGESMRDVTEGVCDAARATAEHVCLEIAATMPFVGACEAAAEFDRGEAGCAVRLTAAFWSVDPAAGVFTTALPGILAFEIR